MELCLSSLNRYPPLLFVLVSECFGQLVRSCKEIQGLTLSDGRESKISQYADDNDYWLLKVLDVFDQYGRASGAKLNRTKSKGPDTPTRFDNATRFFSF
jgi:hypothetical protein